MIDVENKVLKFGYGDICVANRTLGLCFRGIKLPVEIGTALTSNSMHENNIEYTSNWIFVNFISLQELLEFECLINNVCKESPIFKYKDITFDFSNYDYQSAYCIIRHLEVVKGSMLFPVAC